MDGELDMVKIGTNSNPSDLGTKTLSGADNSKKSSLLMNDIDGYFKVRKRQTEKVGHQRYSV